jgi:hypothetical protein
MAIALLLVAPLGGARVAAQSTTPAPAPATTPAPAAPPAVMPSATILGKDKTQSVLGKEVRDSAGEDMGRIANVIVDRSGNVRAAIIDFGGFLGVGNRRIAIDWNALHFSPDPNSDMVTLDLTRDQVKAAPEYVEGKPVVVLGASGGTETVPAEDFPTRTE